MARWFLILGGINALLAVAFGAYGAHGLNALADAARASYDTAVTYETTQGLGLLLIGIIGRLWPNRALAWAGGLLAAGIVLFSGGIYADVLLDAHWLRPVVPVGGTAMMLGWLAFVVGALRLAQG